MRMAALRGGGGLGPKHTVIHAPHSRARNPPHNKIASAEEFASLWYLLLSTQVSGRRTGQSQPCLTAANRLPSFDRSGPELQAHSLELSESQFGIKVIRFIGEHFEVTGSSTSIAHLTELRRVLSRECQLLLVFPELPVLVILNKRVRDPTKSLLNRLPISQHRGWLSHSLWHAVCRVRLLRFASKTWWGKHRWNI